MEGCWIEKKLIHCPNKRAKIRICMKQTTAKKKSALKKAAKTAVSKAKTKNKKVAKPVTKKAAAKKPAVKKAAAKAVKKIARPLVKKGKAVVKKAKTVAKKAKALVKKAKPVVKKSKAVVTKAKVKTAVSKKAAVKKSAAKPSAVVKKAVAGKAKKLENKATGKEKALKPLKVNVTPEPKAEKAANAQLAEVKNVAAPKAAPKKKPAAEKPKRLIIEPPQLKSQAAMTGKAVNPVTHEQETGKAKHKYKKFELEFSINSAHHILFNYLATATGLKEWFADEVVENGDLFTFSWDGADQQAQLISVREDHHIRFHWLDLPAGTYFEFKLETDELTSDLALIITDFAEDADAVESAKSLWHTQIDALFHLIGAHG